MEEKNVPFVVFEGTQARNERTIKRLIVALILAVILIFASNVVWLYAWMQFDYAGEETITVDGKSGNANYVENGGMITNGKDYSSTN